jgi:hypothetical protein
VKFPQLVRAPFETKEQIFNDFKLKAALLLETPQSQWPSLRRRLGIRDWAQAAHAAFQAFFCCVHGFGTDHDLAQAAQYLAVSAQGGFMNAYSVAFEFRDRHGDIELPGWTPAVDGLARFVALGPCVGFPKYLEELRLLRRLDPSWPRRLWPA